MKKSTGPAAVLHQSGAVRVRVRGADPLGRSFQLTRMVAPGGDVERVRAELAAAAVRIASGEESRPALGRPRGAPHREVTCALESRDVERLDALGVRVRRSRRALLRRAVLALLESEGA
jgi:hypothetical protein